MLEESNVLSSSFSMRKIPVSQQENTFETENNQYKDKIKIIELSNIIDEWEKELLFSENGFYSLKGKLVENKTREFINELEKFINLKLEQIQFYSFEAKESAKQVKQLKIDNMKRQMLNYEAQELFNWEIEVYNNALEAAINKAVVYKNNEQVLSLCLKNGLSALELMSQREKWNDKITKIKKEEFLSRFYSTIIASFLEEKDFNFILFFEKYKKFLSEEKLQEFDKSIKELKNKIIAYNWAKELFSYNLSNEENEEKINSLKDKDLETNVRIFIDILKKTKEKIKKTADEELAQKSWQKIQLLLEKEPDKAILYVDFNQPKEFIKSQKEYIYQIVKNGYIKTDKSIYLKLIGEICADISKFKNNSLLEYKGFLSEEDFNFFVELQKQPFNNIFIFASDCNKIETLFENISDEKKYKMLKMMLKYLSQYKEINGKEADIEKKHKIIEIIQSDFAKNDNKEKKNDGIINNTSK